MSSPSNSQRSMASSGEGRLARPGGVIPGELTTLVDARTRVDYPIPSLPAAVLTDPCNPARSFSLTLKDVWATWTSETLRPDRQIGLTYNGGIWVSITPKGLFHESIAAASELPPVSAQFDAGDFPTGISTGMVRSHVAWVSELEPGSLCSTNGNNVSPNGRTADGASVISVLDEVPERPDLNGTAALPFDEKLIAHVSWMENGTVIHLAGPYSLATLQSLAGGITFL